MPKNTETSLGSFTIDGLTFDLRARLDFEGSPLISVTLMGKYPALAIQFTATPDSLRQLAELLENAAAEVERLHKRAWES